MGSPHDKYQSIFTSRYSTRSPLLTVFSERNRIEKWRQLWTWLAEAQLQLGCQQVTQEKVSAMKASIPDIDWQFAADREKVCRHDVMAHIGAYEKACPTAAGTIHLGATSCFVQDNADLLIIRQALNHVQLQLVVCIERLAKFAAEHKSLVTVGRTHYQAASITTVGKRACLWLQELVMAFEVLNEAVGHLKFRGIKGATGTQDSFVTLFDGDTAKVNELDKLVTKLAGFDPEKQRFTVTGQTYTRLLDAVLLNALSILGAAVHKCCMDIRLSQANRELMEPFEADQIGSSAMPYKRNPMRSERCCSLARYLMSLPQTAINTAATQGFERTLDDSANRRIIIPDAFLTADTLLTTYQNIIEGMHVQHTSTAQHVKEELPFLALEKILMRLTKHGKSRQEGHERIRSIALAAHEKREKGEPIELVDMIKDDEFFADVREYAKDLVNDPMIFCGRCVEQVDEFLKEQVGPITDSWKEKMQAAGGKKATLDV